MANRRRQQRVWLLAHGRFERAMRVDIARARNRFVKAAARQYEETGSIPAHMGATYEAALAKVLETHLKRITPHFASLATRELKKRHAALERKADDRFLLAMLEWVRTRALNNAATVARTDTTQIRRRIQEGIEAGDGSEAIARSIRDVATLTPYRAATIARTETSIAANWGAREDARITSEETGIVLVKEWVATNDDRTRQSHIDADGEMVALDESFLVDGEYLDRPGDDGGSPENIINCRCFCSYTEKDE